MSTIIRANTNITSDELFKCSSRCKLRFDYSEKSEATITATKTTNKLEIEYPVLSNTVNVQFNGESYNQHTKIYVYRPNINAYRIRNERIVGEMVISHNNGYEHLLLYIPLILSTESNIFFKELFKTTETDYNTIRPPTSTAFNLKNIVSPSPFYYYYGTASTDMNIPKSHNVIFNTTAGIPISQTHLNLLPQHTLSITDASEELIRLQYNTGITSEEGNDIYIDCNPVDDNGNTLKNNYKLENIDSGRVMKTFGSIVGVLFVLLLIGIGYMFYKKGDKNAIKIGKSASTVKLSIKPGTT